MIVGAAVLPTAPLLVPGVAPTVDGRVGAVADAVDATVEQLRPRDATVLIAAAPSTTVHGWAVVSLAGIGRPDIDERRPVHEPLAAALAAALGVEVVTADRLPLALSVLALLLGSGDRVVPITVPVEADFAALTGVGDAVAAAVDGDDAPDVLVVAAGDLSAGNGPDSPHPEVEGGDHYDRAVVDVVDSGRLDQLAGYGPQEARRVHATGWPALAALHGVLHHAKVGLVRRRYAAPFGVGYLVAHGG